MKTKSPQAEILSYIAGTDIESAFLELRQKHDEYCWQVADLIARLYSLMRAEGKEFTALDVCHAANIILNDDIGAFSLYNYWLVGKIITTKKDRAKYNVLPFSHLLYARQYAEATKTDWRHVLDYDLKMMDKKGGRCISKESLQAQFSVLSDQEPPEYDDMGSLQAQNSPEFDKFILENSTQGFKGIVEAVKFIERHFDAISSKAQNKAQRMLASQIAGLCRRFYGSDFDAMEMAEAQIINTSK